MSFKSHPIASTFLHYLAIIPTLLCSGLVSAETITWDFENGDLFDTSGTINLSITSGTAFSGGPGTILTADAASSPIPYSIATDTGPGSTGGEWFIRTDYGFNPDAPGSTSGTFHKFADLLAWSTPATGIEHLASTALGGGVHLETYRFANSGDRTFIRIVVSQ